MILGIKSRWFDVYVNQVINLSSDVELHLELEDIDGLFLQQVDFLKGLPKTFHVHAPFKKDGRYIDFVRDFDVFRDCVLLGDAINKGVYHLVIHASINDLGLIKENASKLLKLSSKVVLCFESLHDSPFFNRAVDFRDLMKFKSDRVMLCLDVCHAFLNGSGEFDMFIDLFKEKIVHVHLADMGVNHEHGLQIGSGVIDFRHVISRLRECACPVLIPEVTGSQLNCNEGLITAFNKIRVLLLES